MGSVREDRARRPRTKKARSNERASCLRLALQQRDAVADDQAVLVEVAAGGRGIAADHCIAPAHAEVFQGTFLHGVADIQVALPFLAIAPAGTGEVFTGYITDEGDQAGYAIGGEVDVVARLPGLLVLAGEVEDLQIGRA